MAALAPIPSRNRRFVKRRVLCIDDHTDSLEALDFVLGEAGFVCRMAKTYDDAQWEIQNKLFDAYIIDHRLPGGSGIDLILLIRNRDRNTPIIFVSADPRNHVQEEVLRCGADAFLSKPYDPFGLVMMVNKQVGEAEFRNVEARMEERVAILDTLTEQTKAVTLMLREARESIRKVHAIRFAAREAFMRAGGTPIGFSRLWDPSIIRFEKKLVASH
jgi:DNA-binding response OmpR family regulator